MDKDQAKGHVKEAKDTVKELAGRVTGDNVLEYKGKAERQGDNAEAGYGDLKKNDIKKSIK